jgi:hypothetical protein
MSRKSIQEEHNTVRHQKARLKVSSTAFKFSFIVFEERKYLKGLESKLK